MKTFASSQDELTWPGFTRLPPPSENKIKQSSETMVFKILNISQQRTVVPQTWQDHEGSLTAAPAHCLEGHSRHGMERGCSGRQAVFMSHGDGAGCPGGQGNHKPAESTPDRRGLHRKIATETCRGLSFGIWLNPYQHMLMRRWPEVWGMCTETASCSLRQTPGKGIASVVGNN